MTAPNRVDELRKRYHENPKRFFAPLANEYRKTGFIDRAILLCEKHLAEQPENMNGLVVYGQCLFESGRHADANAPFEAALAVDPENLIALRHLGDIARLEGQQEAARAWYERVLELDRRNEEVLELIEQVGGRESREPSSGPSHARSIISVASSVSVAAPDVFMLGNIDLGAHGEPAAEPAPEPAAEPAASLPLAPPSASAPTVVRTSARALPPDSTAKTVEIPDPSRSPRPPRRASLLDIAFDFGEGDMMSAPAPAAPSAPVPRAPIRTPEPIAQVEVELEVDVEVEGRELTVLPTSSSVMLDLETASSVEDLPADSLLELSPELGSLGDLPQVDGLVAAEFDMKVEPVADLESTEFQGGDAEPLAGLVAEDLDFGDGAPIVEADSVGFLHEETPDASAEPLPPLMPEERAVEFAELPGGESEEVDEAAPLTDTPRTFVTETMAKLYLQQGFRDRAIDVYRQLIEQDPGDAGMRDRLAALEVSERSSLGFEPTIEEDAPVEVDPPANAMLADVSFADVALATPPEPVRASGVVRVMAAPVPEVVASGPTARDFLRAFAHRAVTPALTPSVSGARAPAGALDALFGSSVSDEDERAAHRLAAVGATSGPSGGTAMDSLFGEGPSAPAPELIARVSRASERLKFDQFFTPPSAEEVSSAEGVPEAEPDTGENQPTGEDAEGEDDDLDQFQGWLRGLSE